MIGGQLIITVTVAPRPDERSTSYLVARSRGVVSQQARALLESYPELV